MALTIEQLDLEIENAKAAFSNNDFGNARKYIALAEFTLSSLQDYEIGDRKITYRRNIINNLSKVIDKQEQLIKSSSGRGRTIRSNYVRS